VTLNQPAYKTYTNYLPAYMAAYCDRQSRSVMNPYHPLLYKASDPLFSTSFPDVSVSFPGVPASELLEVIRSNGGRELSVKGTKTFIIPSPTSDLLKALVSGGANKTTPASEKSVNIDALASLGLIRRIFSNFLFTHQYPAFVDGNHLDYVEAHWQQEVSHKRGLAQSDSAAGSSRKRARTEGSSPAVGGDDDFMEQEIAEIPMGDKLIKAIPPNRINVAWGDEQSIPEGNGIFVRFVEETQNSEKERAIHETLARYFLGCLGATPDAVRTSYERIKKDLGVIVGSSEGKELAHLAKCIDIGIQCQARIFPLVSSEQYLGCILLGAGFQISAYGTVYSPEPAASLQNRVEQAGSHRSALRAIANIVDDDSMSDEHQGVMDSVSLVSLRNVLKEASLTAENRDQIVAVARGLRFRPKSLNVSADNLVDCFRLIQHPNEPLPITLPISPRVLFEEDRVAVVWSAFGELAPSCNFPGGAQINLESSKDLPKHIGFRNIPLKDAVNDLETIMTHKRFSNTSLNRRSGVFKDRLYKGLDSSKILSAMSSAAGIVHEKGTKKTVGAGNVDPALFDDGF